MNWVCQVPFAAYEAKRAAGVDSETVGSDFTQHVNLLTMRDEMHQNLDVSNRHLRDIDSNKIETITGYAPTAYSFVNIVKV